MARPTRWARSSSPAAPSAMLPGNGVAPPQRVQLAALLVGGDQQGRRARVERRGRPLDGRRSARGPAPGDPELKNRNSVIPAAGAVAKPPPDVAGQLVPVEREHQPAQRVERVGGVAVNRVSP